MQTDPISGKVVTHRRFERVYTRQNMTDMLGKHFLPKNMRSLCQLSDFQIRGGFFFVSRRFASRIHEISDLKKKALVLSLRAGYTRLRDKKTY